MVQLLNHATLEFDHLVEFTQDSTVFAAARDIGNDHIRLFMVKSATGNVYARNGRAQTWEELYGHTRDSIIARIISARNNNIPVYQINGTNASLS